MSVACRIAANSLGRVGEVSVLPDSPGGYRDENNPLAGWGCLTGWLGLGVTIEMARFKNKVRDS